MSEQPFSPDNNECPSVIANQLVRLKRKFEKFFGNARLDNEVTLEDAISRINDLEAKLQGITRNVQNRPENITALKSEGYTAPTGTAAGTGWRITNDGSTAFYGGSHAFNGVLFITNGTYLVSIGSYLSTTNVQYPDESHLTVDGETHHYHWNGSSYDELVTIGLEGTLAAVLFAQNKGLDNYPIYAKTEAAAFHAIQAVNLSVAANAVNASISASGSGDAVRGANTGTGDGVGGISTDAYGVHAERGIGGTAPLRIANEAGSTVPSNSALLGALKVLSNGLLYINDSGSTAWELVGDQHTTRWDDLRIPLLSSKLGGSKDPTFAKFRDDGSGSQGVFAYHFDATIEEELYFLCQLPHGYVEGNDIKPHIHWAPSDGNSGDVRWGLEYTWADVNENFGNTTIIYVDDAADGTTDKHQIASFGSITGTGYKLSSILVCRIFRDATHANDTYGSDAVGFEVDIHVEVNQIGSVNEFSN